MIKDWPVILRLYAICPSPRRVDAALAPEDVGIQAIREAQVFCSLPKCELRSLPLSKLQSIPRPRIVMEHTDVGMTTRAGR